VSLSSILGSLALHADPKSPTRFDQVFSYERVEGGAERVHRFTWRLS